MNRYGYTARDGRELIVYRETKPEAADAFLEFTRDGAVSFDEVHALPTLAEESRAAAKLEDNRKAPGA